MPLIARIIGDCPQCGESLSFGNISVHCASVLRGCLWCSYRTEVPLPEVRKKVIYLDQFFFSLAFREKNQRFVTAVERLTQLSLNQVLVVPYSSVHEDETFQWLGANGKTSAGLMDFIKRTSAGHEFERSSTVQREQLVASFERFLAKTPPLAGIDPDTALPHDIHCWSDYYWIDVSGHYRDADKVREMKQASARSLIRLFPKWRSQVAQGFDEALASELQQGARAYLQVYVENTQKVMAGDVQAALDPPIGAYFVQALLSCFDASVPMAERVAAIRAFFDSEHYTQSPYERLSAGMFALLKDRVRRGAYPDDQKAELQLRGFFHDVEHIATYAPYCDAVFVDNAVADIVRDKRLSLKTRYNTEVFSLARWEEFETWLVSLDASLSISHRRGLEEAYPVSLADPIEVVRARSERSER